MFFSLALLRLAVFRAREVSTIARTAGALALHTWECCGRAQRAAEYNRIEHR